MKTVNLVVEDSLGATVLKRILLDLRIHIGSCYGFQGNGYIKKRVSAFYNASKHTPYLVLTDLDNTPCPPQLISVWLAGITPAAGFMFRVAVKEVESWILADKQNCAAYLAVSAESIPNVVEEIDNPKEFLIELAKKSRKKEIREDIAPSAGSSARRGKNYNGALIRFVAQSWDYNTAAQHSKSLKSAIAAIKHFAAA